MRPSRRNIKLLRIHFPAMLFVERNCGHAGVAPEQTHVRVGGNKHLAAAEQFAAETFALMRIVRGHATELPRRLVFVGIQHETRAGNWRRNFRRRIKNGQMPRAFKFIAGKLRTLLRQAGPEQAMAQIENHVHGDSADGDVSRIVPNEYFLHVLARKLTELRFNEHFV